MLSLQLYHGNPLLPDIIESTIHIMVILQWSYVFRLYSNCSKYQNVLHLFLEFPFNGHAKINVKHLKINRMPLSFPMIFMYVQPICVCDLSEWFQA